MKGFAFGQYYPADSVMHRLDPRMKVIIALFTITKEYFRVGLTHGAIVQIQQSAALGIHINDTPAFI